jgi:putative transposase
LEAGAGCFGIIVQFCPRRKPWYKGKIERFFGTLNSGLLVDMKGKTFSSVMLKGDYDPAKHAVMTLQTLRRVLHTWIVDIYHQENHAGLSDSTPAQVWSQDVAGIDRYLPPSSLAMDSAFSKSEKRKLTHKGIELDSLFYNCAELGRLRELHGHEFEVEVRSYDDDLGSIVVVGPDGKLLIRVPAVDIKYAEGLTRWQHRVCKRFQRRSLEDEGRHISLLDARERIRRLIAQDMALASRKTRGAQQRFLQQEEATKVPEPPADTPAPSATPTAPVESPLAPANDSGPAGTVVPVSKGKKPPAGQAAPVEDAEEVPNFTSRRTAAGGR